MSNKIVLRQAASTHRRQPLLNSQSSRTAIVGEVIGSTAAECLAVACCCPCGLANIFLLAVYKLPAGLCRKILRKRRRRRIIKEGLIQPKRRNCCCGCCDDVNGVPRIYPMCINDASDIKRLHDGSFENNNDENAIALEKEMWERFYSAGFWRSSSRRENSESRTEMVSGKFQVQLIELKQQTTNIG
ncbi:unnamed protein product [Vicia faba]|uniref:Uncharacterized protein n=1 Tax=Vicia faba TaxID=3906 RepID=A0AAV1AXR7_VICFA|nr:unnamed protein product [Vicia faba]